MTIAAPKKILLGITGGIAAYKTAELIRFLVTAEVEVKVVMTESAQRFITPLTLQALSGNPVYTELFPNESTDNSAMEHIELSRWADVVLIAPATANTIAKISNGIADNLLTNLVLANQNELFIAPAMNSGMWKNLATQANIATLERRGVKILPPTSGELACGEDGVGRMLEPELIAQHFVTNQDTLLTVGNANGTVKKETLLNKKTQKKRRVRKTKLSGKNVVITAGPTREYIDPVRFISNCSSGKMGFAIADAAVAAGAKVNLISGPVALDTPDGVENRVDVTTAQQMYEEVVRQQCDIFIATAAVADYRPKHSAKNKIKSSRTQKQLHLTANQDILATVAQQKNSPFTLGFAAETIQKDSDLSPAEQLEQHAKDKLKRKKCNMIAANIVGEDGVGFDVDHNALTVVTKDKITNLEKNTKAELAEQLVKLLIKEIP